jgi:hypothetical protein
MVFKPAPLLLIIIHLLCLASFKTQAAEGGVLIDKSQGVDNTTDPVINELDTLNESLNNIFSNEDADAEKKLLDVNNTQDKANTDIPYTDNLNTLNDSLKKIFSDDNTIENSETKPEIPLDQTNTGWLLLYSNPAYCDEICRRALHTLRQSRLMLGNEMGRLQRVFLHGDTVPDTVFLAEEHRGLITAQNSSLTGLLIEKRPANLPAGGYFLIDPLGNLVMYFRPDLEPAEMVDDIKHLLRLSRIG